MTEHDPNRALVRMVPMQNNLTLVRLVLASAVIWTHCIWRLTGSEGDEFVPIIGETISTLAVDGFFFLSGFLVYGSLLRRGSAWDFALARLARLWPGLAVSVLLVVAIGLFLTAAPPSGYLRGDTARFVIGNLSLMRGHYTLTGIALNGAPANINGSLWTIPWEVRCYVILFLVALLGLTRPRRIVPLVLLPTALLAIVAHFPAFPAAIKAIGGEALLFNVNIVEHLWTTFALGIAALVFWPRLRLSWAMCAALFVLLVASVQWFPVPHLASIVAGYFVLCAGFRSGTLSARWPDYSYGMYIYAFPVMMALAGLFAFRAHGMLALANLAATLPLAALSWHCVEHPVLRLVRSRRKG